jgi:hypothetical protein
VAGRMGKVKFLDKLWDLAKEALNRDELITIGYLFRRGYCLEYLDLHGIIVERVQFKWFKLRYVHGPNKLVK